MKKSIQSSLVVLLMSLFVLSSLSSVVFAQDSISISNIIEIVVKDVDDVIQIHYSINDFSTKQIDVNGASFSQIILGDESHLKVKGAPDLPTISRSIIIPDDKQMKVRVVHTQYEEFDEVNLIPSKGIVYRDISYDEITYNAGNIYEKNEFYPDTIVELGEPYILRDLRGQVVTLYPFQYNPVQQTLRFYTDITIEVYPSGEGKINCFEQPMSLSTIDVDFSMVYNNHFINYDSLFYDPVEEQGNMIVITYDDFWDSMIPFVEWKNMKGIPTEMIRVSEIGGSTEIKNYISNYYNSNGLTFVLLVGDVDQIPTLHASGGASDPSYSYIVGDDHYPDLFVGRFSAQTIEQVNTQVERSIEYEKYAEIGANWYHKGTGIASNQGPGDDGEDDDEHIDFIRDDLLAFTYTEVDQFYDPYGTSTDVANALFDGRSVINYCGHGSPSRWSSTGFSSTDVNELENDNMLPFIWSVACNNGEFDDYDSCFAETWLRATNGDEPAGAIAMFASSISQSWDPPMDAQDEFNDLLVSGEKSTIGGLSYNGVMHMNDEYGYDGWEMTDTWILFGDPSLQVRTDTPEEITVVHDPSLDMGDFSTEIEVVGVEGAFCVLSRNSEVFGSGYTDETGQVTIGFGRPMPPGDDLDVVVSGFNLVPCIGQVEVIGESDPPEQPETPEGPHQGAPGDELSYSSSAIEPDGDEIYYMWDWGDGNFSEWLGPYSSEELCSESHIWTVQGVYSIRVKAKDYYGLESDWSDPLEIAMPRGKIFVVLLSFLEQYFPGIYSWIIDFVQK